MGEKQQNGLSGRANNNSLEIISVRSGLRSLSYAVALSAKIFAGLMPALLGLVSSVCADDGTNPVAFHSQTFVRTKGSPNNYTATFKVHAWVVGWNSYHPGGPGSAQRKQSRKYEFVRWRLGQHSHELRFVQVESTRGDSERAWMRSDRMTKKAQ
jgi:hypothetical protein